MPACRIQRCPMGWKRMPNSEETGALTGRLRNPEELPGGALGGTGRWAARAAASRAAFSRAALARAALARAASTWARAFDWASIFLMFVISVAFLAATVAA